MKRFGAIVSLVLIIVMMVSGLSFAAGQQFSVESTYPADGSTGKSIDNFGIKIYFNEEIGAAATLANNKDCVIVKDDEGEKVPISLYYSTKGDNLMMALVEPENKGLIKQNTEYTVTVTSDFQNSKGEALGKDYSISFKTLNQTRSTTVNMLMMAVMFGGIMLFSAKAMKGETEQAEEKKPGNDKVNPYKEAKKTGKSVEEVVAKDQKAKAKKAASEARRIAKDKALRDKIEKETAEEEVKQDSGVKHVKGPRPISAGGSTYITGRKAAAEAAAKEAMQRGTTRPKNHSAKKNNKK